MNNEERLIEVMAELLAEVHEMRTDTKQQFTTLNNRVEKIDDGIVALNKRVDKLENEMTKVNLHLAENTRAILKLADKIDLLPGIIERISKLEVAVFKNPPMKKI